MKIKIDKSDKVYSHYIRLRDGRCVRCGSKVRLNEKGLPVSHQVSHYFGRWKESTRFFDPNVDTTCFACHRIWGSDDREAYRRFKIKQLGEEEFDKLTLKANIPVKKDRKMAYIIVKKKLEELKEKK